VQRVMLCFAALCAVTGLGANLEGAERPKLSTAHGRQLFEVDGCYECHGHSGQGTDAAPRLAPDPMPLEVITHVPRNPPHGMPIYTVAVLSEADIADIYAYLSSIPKPKAVAEIPLLNP
jgi:mono/diheme cytochrome c family protein